MFELSLDKSNFLPRFLMVSGAVDKRQALPILANILFQIEQGQLTLTATDLEIEISAFLPCPLLAAEKVTVPAKKLIDILRSLDEDVQPKIQAQQDSVMIKAGRSQFKLATLPADQFPVAENEAFDLELSFPRQDLIYLLQSTCFAMSQQDIRVFLNGLLLEFDATSILAVATDGHRMALCKVECDTKISHLRLLLPRKGVMELLKLLNLIQDEKIQLLAGANCFGILSKDYKFTSKLIESRYPPYKKAVPLDNDKSVLVERDALKRALSRIIILANEKSKAVMLHLQAGNLTLIANNQEQEEAIESLEAKVEGDELKIGLNASYLLDVLNALPEGLVRLSLSNVDRSILVESTLNDNFQYVIMPMTL